jgi:hypothetical protein
MERLIREAIEIELHAYRNRERSFLPEQVTQVSYSNPEGTKSGLSEAK